MKDIKQELKRVRDELLDTDRANAEAQTDMNCYRFVSTIAGLLCFRLARVDIQSELCGDMIISVSGRHVGRKETFKHVSRKVTIALLRSTSDPEALALHVAVGLMSEFLSRNSYLEWERSFRVTIVKIKQWIQ